MLGRLLEDREESLQWFDYPTEEAALEAFKASETLVSMVMFDLSGTPVRYSTVDGVDAAIILEAYRAGDLPKRDEIKRRVENGDLPLVPPRQAASTQWLLKKSMLATFNRKTVQFFGAAPYRNVSRAFYDVAAHPGVKGHVALTLDDAPCRFRRKRCSRVKEIQSLLQEYDATATFMIIGKFVDGHEDDLVDLLKAGHEFGNHGNVDRSYLESSREDFATA